MFRGHLGRVVTNAEPVVVNVHLDQLDTWKPIQGIFDLVRSGVSDQFHAFGHVLDVQRDDPRAGGLGVPGQFRVLLVQLGVRPRRILPVWLDLGNR